MADALDSMFSYDSRTSLGDPGEPEKCPAFQLHKIYCTPGEIDHVTKGCRTATIGCLECKKIMIRHVIEELGPVRERRAAFEKEPHKVADILASGQRVAQKKAAETMDEVRQTLGL